MLTLVWSPVRYFRARLAEPPRWALAMTAPVLCVLLDVGAVYVLAGKLAGALGHLAASGAISDSSLRAARWSSLTTAVGFPACFAGSVLIMACVDVLHADTGRQRRFVDLVGLAFAAFVPGCAFALAVALMWSPPPLSGAGFAMSPDVVVSYAAGIRNDPWISTSWLIYHFGLMWYSALLAVILKVAGVLSGRAAVLAAVLMFISLGGYRLLSHLPSP